MAEDYHNVLDFWFGGGTDAEVASRQSGLWWGKSADVDRKIQENFEADLQTLVRGEHRDWLTAPEGTLAAIVVLDQFSRNMYRDSPRAFAQDAMALRLCLEGMDNGVDQKLRPIQRVFFYMPLEHAESMKMQNRSVAVFEQLRDEAPEENKKLFAGFVDFAEKHRVIIERFGRYPHRNKILGRESTAEEVEFLRQPGSSF
ncbi:DUF924 family protein [Porticoccus sp. W117]|uniref:DUF924 family protein n=1 Tax=Porticoccus sp. W117 TaxID=3054777 RepID=UPI002593666E|nr:DUF924 family protein [Porticoccus sp. W117]MDM3870429.1 DUF924 family protein [Porticoccus sp. W117]